MGEPTPTLVLGLDEQPLCFEWSDIVSVVWFLIVNRTFGLSFLFYFYFIELTMCGFEDDFLDLQNFYFGKFPKNLELSPS